jgi:hypothetical protein
MFWRKNDMECVSGCFLAGKSFLSETVRNLEDL